jgi:hypothetical protein
MQSSPQRWKATLIGHDGRTIRRRGPTQGLFGELPGKKEVRYLSEFEVSTALNIRLGRALRPDLPGGLVQLIVEASRLAALEDVGLSCAC